MSSVEQSLSLLLPTISDRLPPELVNLSHSLLAQSRLHASNLKAEEEIARPYACSEIACQRIGSRLKLPARVGRPPCAPRVYKKLLAFLERTLPPSVPPSKSSRPVETPSKEGQRKRKRNEPDVDPLAKDRVGGKAGEGQHWNERRGSEQDRPRKRIRSFVGKIQESSSAANVNHHAVTDGNMCNDDGAPVWVMPLIRRLCYSFGVSSAAVTPHVYTGFCVVLKLADNEKIEAGLEAQGEERTKEIKALLIALFFLVLTRMLGEKLTKSAYLDNCKRARGVVNHVKVDASSQIRQKKKDSLTSTLQHPRQADHSGFDEQSVSSRRSPIADGDIERWIRTIATRRWAVDQDWWCTVPQNTITSKLGIKYRRPNEQQQQQHSRTSDDNDNNGNGNGIPSPTNEHATPNHHHHPQQRNVFTFALANDHNHSDNDKEDISSCSSSFTTDSYSDSGSDSDSDSNPPILMTSYLKPGLATMLQESHDFLGRAHRFEYRRWLKTVEKEMMGSGGGGRVLS